MTQTHKGPVVIAMNEYEKSKQNEKTFHLLPEWEDYACIVSNVPVQLNRHQGNINLCGFASPILQTNDLMKKPMDLLTDEEWKELNTCSSSDLSSRPNSRH